MKSWRWLMLVPGLVVALLLAGCGGGTPVGNPAGQTATSGQGALPTPTPTLPSRPSQGLARMSDAGRVTVEVTPMNLDSPGEKLEFAVGMNTHSVELSYDLAELAVLRDDRGREVKALAWDGEKGGHHVSGRLSFPGTAPDGSPLVGDGVAYLELIIHDVADVPERVFRWDLGQ